MKNTGISKSNHFHNVTVEEVNGYTSVPFDIVCERCQIWSNYKYVVINNRTKETVEVVENIFKDDLKVKRDELIFKYLIELAK